MKPRILVLGGGMGGVHTARELSRKIGNEDGINLADILVFERKKESLYAPSLTWLMVGMRQTNELYRELNQIEYNGVEIIEGEIVSVDPASKTVISDGKKYQGDYMIISLGVAQIPALMKTPSAHNFYTVDGAQSYYEDLKSFDGDTITILISSLPYKSPVAPYEAAMLTDHYLRKHNKRDGVTIQIYTPEEKPMPFAHPDISSRVLELLNEKNIQYHPNHTFAEEKEGKIGFQNQSGEIVFTEPGLIAYTPQHEAPKLLVDAGLTGESGWISPDPDTLETNYDNVFAIGDVIELSDDRNQPMPKAGIFAQHQAEVVASNIARKISGKVPDKTYTYRGSYILDEGGRGTKISGDFEPGGTQTNKESALRHWEKVLTEKAWFLKNF